MTPPPRHGSPSHHAVEILGDGSPGPLLLTCEHASNRVPRPLRSTASDRAWLKTHWGLDIGARTVTREVARRTGSQAVMARFSRLVCDPNRPPDHVDFVRTEVEGAAISFNQYLDQAELLRRQLELHAPFHDAIDQALAQRLTHDRDVLLLSVHSFTPIWNHRLREMDFGLVYENHEAVAARLGDLLGERGFDCAHNQPYSARGGLAYSVDRHGQHHDVVHLEIEINQSLVCTPQRARRVGAMLAHTLEELRLRTPRR